MPQSFETERLIIRAPLEADAEMVQPAIEETFESLTRWMPWARTLQSLDETRTVLREAAEKFDRGEDFMLLLIDRATGQYVGGSGLHRIDWSVPKFEIGYWVRRSRQGRGYVTEAVRAIAGVAFDVLGAKRVEIRMSSKNIRSRAVAERAGFTLEGIARNDERHNDGTLRDTCYYARIDEGS